MEMSDSSGVFLHKFSVHHISKVQKKKFFYQEVENGVFFNKERTEEVTEKALVRAMQLMIDCDISNLEMDDVCISKFY